VVRYLSPRLLLFGAKLQQLAVHLLGVCSSEVQI
jgi:hypothetical protein